MDLLGKCIETIRQVIARAGVAIPPTSERCHTLKIIFIAAVSQPDGMNGHARGATCRQVNDIVQCMDAALVARSGLIHTIG